MPFNLQVDLAARAVLVSSLPLHFAAALVGVLSGFDFLNSCARRSTSSCFSREGSSNTPIRNPARGKGLRSSGAQEPPIETERERVSGPVLCTFKSSGNRGIVKLHSYPWLYCSNSCVPLFMVRNWLRNIITLSCVCAAPMRVGKI